MTFNEQKKAMEEWRNRPRKVEFSMPGDVFERIGIQAAKRNISCADFILEAIEKTLNASPHERDDDRISRIQAQRNPPSNPELTTLIKEMRANRFSWQSVAEKLNERGLLSPRGKEWTDASLRAYVWCNGVEQGDPEHTTNETAEIA